MEAEYLWSQYCEDNDIPNNFKEFMEVNELSIEDADILWDEILYKFDKFKNCTHSDIEVVEEFDNGYFKLKCKSCDYEFIDG